jgi:pimeloyl-ACP methyl ester carboxylesterase
LITDVAVPGSRVRVEVDGDGPPVLLVHSGLADRTMWSDVVERLAGERTLIRPDLRGYGASAAPEAAFRHSDDLVAVLDHLGLDRVAVVGSSFGGLLSLLLASARPERVASLVVLAPPRPGHDWSAGLRAYFDAEEEALRAGDLDGAVELNLQTWVRGPVRAWTPELGAVAERIRPALRVALGNQLALDEYADEPPLDLDRLAIPTTVVVGDADQPDFVAIAEHLANALPGARYHRWPGLGHLLPLEDPDVTARVIVESQDR